MYQRILRQSDYRYGFFLLSESHRCGRLLSRSDLNNSPEKLKNCPKSTQKNDINRLRLPKAPLFAGLARRPHPRHTAGRAERAERFRAADQRGSRLWPWRDVAHHPGFGTGTKTENSEKLRIAFSYYSLFPGSVAKGSSVASISF